MKKYIRITQEKYGCTDLEEFIYILNTIYPNYKIVSTYDNDIFILEKEYDMLKLSDKKLYKIDFKKREKEIMFLREWNKAEKLREEKSRIAQEARIRKARADEEEHAIKQAWFEKGW